MKHLDAASILEDPKELKLFIDGLQKIVQEEIGETGKAFTVIVTNEMEKDYSFNFGI